MSVIVTGYKATDGDIKCRGYQFVPGQWHEHEGKVEVCESGFHFCLTRVGPLHYYPIELCASRRLWQVEAQGVTEYYRFGQKPATKKLAAKKIKLVREIFPLTSGNFNYTSIGIANDGEFNDGNYNIGNNNFGNYNVGLFNTGLYNVGNNNTGNYNLGNYNTGSYNVGNYNSGDYNIGNYNSGIGNIGNHNKGLFCTDNGKELNYMFDAATSFTSEELLSKFKLEIEALLVYIKIKEREVIWEVVNRLPNITKTKLNNLLVANYEIRKTECYSSFD
jgi:hypothetical protein